MEMRNVNFDDLLEAINIEPDREEVLAGLKVSFARIRDAFKVVDEQDGDAQFVLDLVEKVLEPGLLIFTDKWDNVSDVVKRAVGDLATEFGKTHAAISDIAEVRLRAQGRYYDFEPPGSAPSSEKDDGNDGGLDPAA